MSATESPAAALPGVVLLDAPPTIGHNIQRAVDEVATADGASNKVNDLIYSHHHADQGARRRCSTRTSPASDTGRRVACCCATTVQLGRRTRRRSRTTGPSRSAASDPRDNDAARVGGTPALVDPRRARSTIGWPPSTRTQRQSTTPGQGVDAGQIALAGESAGGGLAVATLLTLRDAGTPLPSSAFLMSPCADLTLSGETILENQAIDPILMPEGLRLRVPDYVGRADASDPQISPVFGDLSGLPPLLIQVGSHEILLSDAIRLAGRAAVDEVPVTLEVTPGVPHVFQGFAAVLDEGDAALDRASTFLKTQFAATQPS